MLGPTAAGSRFLCRAAVLAWLGTCGSALAATSTGGRFVHDVWTTDDGLPENSANSIVQTPDGYLWLGTYEGLVRFDGVSFEVFDRTNTPELTTNTVYELLVDREGALWVGTSGAGLLRRKEGAFTAFTSRDGRSGFRGDVVRTLFESRDGTLWVGTDTGLYRRRGEAFVRLGSGEGLASEAVRALAEDREGRLWVGTVGGLFRLDRPGAPGERFRQVATREGLSGAVVRALLVDGRDRLWVGTSGGLDLQEGEGLPFRHYGVAEGLSMDIVTALYEDRQGTLWVGTNGQGVDRLEDGVVSHLPPSSAVGEAIVYGLAEDREGSLWVGTYARGLHRLRRSAFTPFTVRDGLPHDIVKGLGEGRDGSLWVATNGGGLARLHQGRFAALGRREGLSSDIVITVVEDRRGDVWVGTYLAGLDLVRGGRVVRTYTTADGLPDQHVTALLEGRDGELWVGTYGGGVARLQENRFTAWGPAVLGNGVVRTLLQGRGGEVWVGTNEGLARISGARAESFGSGQGLRPGGVVSLHEDERGDLWLGGRGGGLTRLRGGRFRTCTTREGLFSDVVYSIVPDGRGWLWMSCDKGLFRVRKAEVDELLDGRRDRITSDSYGRADGMSSTQCSGGFSPAAWRDRAGTLWFPTIGGLTAVDPARVGGNAVVPPVHVESVRSRRGRRAATAAPLALAPGDDALEIHYTAPSFLMPGKVRFRYLLEGFDADWVEAGSRRVAYYTNVPPGRYAFRVQACNGDGVWNRDGAAQALVLQPRFHQTRFFWALLGGVAVLLSLGAHRLRLRQSRRRERELQQLVEERTRGLQAEKERAERARAELEQANEALQQANAVKSDLLGMAAHDLRNPLQLVQGCAEMILGSVPGGTVLHEQASLIHRSTRRMAGLVGHLVETAVLESGRLRLDKRPVDLCALAEVVAEALDVRAANKQQTISVSAAPGVVVEADEVLLREALENLVDNAVKYSPPGAPIEVLVAGTSEVGRCEVTDRGPGLSPEDLSHVFGKFQRLTARPTGGETSTGLGLSIVKQLVEMQGGRVLAESPGPGRGSTFVIELPRVAPAAGGGGPVS